MRALTRKDTLLAVLLGTIGISTGIAAATVMEVVVAPPIQALPFPVVNTAWALVLYHLVSNDIRAGYIGCIFLGISVITLPMLVFFGVIGEAPATVPAHYFGVATDMIFGITLIVTAVRSLKGQ